MSEYFRVLKQVESGQPTDQRQVVRPPAITRPRGQALPAGLARSDAAAAVTPESSLADPLSSAFAGLFDNLRAVAKGSPVRTLVFATTAPDDSASPITAGMARYGKRLGYTVLTAVLSSSGGRAKLHCHTPDSDQSAHGGPSLSVNLRSTAWESGFDEWLRETAPNTDLVLIEGPSLGTSIDAALLAHACDGLVIVAQTKVTPRQALRLAAERARTVGCRTLGVVMHGTTEHLPSWLRRVTGGGARPLITPKGFQTSP